MLPDFSKPFLQQLTEEMIAHNELVLPATGKWTLELDHDLVEMAAEFCYVNNRDIMTLFPGFLVPSDRLLMKYGKLIDFTLSQIQMRFYILQQLNLMLRDILPFINISCDDAYGSSLWMLPLVPARSRRTFACCAASSSVPSRTSGSTTFHSRGSLTSRRSPSRTTAGVWACRWIVWRQPRSRRRARWTRTRPSRCSGRCSSR